LRYTHYLGFNDPIAIESIKIISYELKEFIKEQIKHLSKFFKNKRAFRLSFNPSTRKFLAVHEIKEPKEILKGYLNDQLDLHLSTNAPKLLHTANPDNLTDEFIDEFIQQHSFTKQAIFLKDIDWGDHIPNIDDYLNTKGILLYQEEYILFLGYLIPAKRIIDKITDSFLKIITKILIEILNHDKTQYDLQKFIIFTIKNTKRIQPQLNHYITKIFDGIYENFTPSENISNFCDIEKQEPYIAFLFHLANHKFTPSFSTLQIPYINNLKLENSEWSMLLFFVIAFVHYLFHFLASYHYTYFFEKETHSYPTYTLQDFISSLEKITVETTQLSPKQNNQRIKQLFENFIEKKISSTSKIIAQLIEELHKGKYAKVSKKAIRYTKELIFFNS